jgi:hypothetical protein
VLGEVRFKNRLGLKSVDIRRLIMRKMAFIVVFLMLTEFIGGTALAQTRQIYPQKPQVGKVPISPGVQKSFDLSIDKVFLKDCNIHIVIKNIGSVKVSEAGYRSGLLVIRSRPYNTSWPLTKIDPRKELNGPRRQVAFNTNLKLTQKATVEFLMEKVIGDLSKGRKRVKQVLTPPVMCAEVRPVGKPKVPPPAKPSAQKPSVKGMEPEVLDAEGLKAKKIDIRTLPDNQPIRIEGKIMTVGEIKARAVQQGQMMKAASDRLEREADAKFRQYQLGFERSQAQRQDLLRAKTRGELDSLKKQPTAIDQGSIPPAPKDPVISSLSVNHGQPGDPILISGQDFGNEKGWVEVYVAPEERRSATIGYWSPTQILASVPDAVVQNSYNGGLYVVTAGERLGSNLVSFRFDPAMEVRVLVPQGDNKFRNCGGGTDKSYTNTAVTVSHDHSFFYWGCSLDDEFATRTRLLGSWVVDRVEFTKALSEPGEADASVTEKHLGTSNPYVKVHWWVTAWDQVSYSLAIYVKGPKGTECCVVESSR